MTGNRTVLGLRWGALESRRITDLPPAGMLALGDLGPADGTGPSQTQQQLALQRGARLDGQDLVDRLVRHPTSVILRTAELLPASDLLGRPVLAELARDELAQRWVQSVLAPLRAPGVIRRSPVSLSSAVSASPAMTRYLATHRRGRPARPARNGAGDRTEIEADALGLRRGRLRRPPALPGRARNARRRRGRRDWPRGSASPPNRQRCRTTTESAPRSSQPSTLSMRISCASTRSSASRSSIALSPTRGRAHADMTVKRPVVYACYHEILDGLYA